MRAISQLAWSNEDDSLPTSVWATSSLSEEDIDEQDHISRASSPTSTITTTFETTPTHIVRPRLFEAFVNADARDPDDQVPDPMCNWEVVMNIKCIEYQIETFALFPPDLKKWALTKIGLLDELEHAFDQVHSGARETVIVSVHTPLNAYDRHFVHVFAETYGLAAESYKVGATAWMLSKKLYPMSICRSTESADIIARKQIVAIPEAFSLADMIMPYDVATEAYNDAAFATHKSSVSSSWR
jgi:hypothetical protein